eukprot:6181232-Pleurochrysis_carterae.AAC.3
MVSGLIQRRDVLRDAAKVTKRDDVGDEQRLPAAVIHRVVGIEWAETKYSSSSSVCIAKQIALWSRSNESVRTHS